LPNSKPFLPLLPFPLLSLFYPSSHPRNSKGPGGISYPKEQEEQEENSLSLARARGEISARKGFLDASFLRLLWPRLTSALSFLYLYLHLYS
jgi:hypothetical protein